MILKKNQLSTCEMLKNGKKSNVWRTDGPIGDLTDTVTDRVACTRLKKLSPSIFWTWRILLAADSKKKLSTTFYSSFSFCPHEWSELSNSYSYRFDILSVPTSSKAWISNWRATNLAIIVAVIALKQRWAGCEVMILLFKG